MKRILWIFLLLLMPTVGLFAFSPSDQAQFEKANIAYRESKFDEAAALYKVLSEKHPNVAAFQFNYGNALQKKGELGTAILAFERARLAEPRNSDINYNLNYMRALVEYRVEDKRNEMIKITEKLLGYLTFEEILLSALGLGIFFFAVWAWVLFFNQDTSWGSFRKFLFMIVLTAFSLAAIKSIQRNFFSEAIITVKEAQVYYGPSVTDQSAFRLGEGLKVYCVDEREGWSRILLASGESGWIQKDLIGEIRTRN